MKLFRTGTIKERDVEDVNSSFRSPSLRNKETSIDKKVNYSIY